MKTHLRASPGHVARTIAAFLAALLYLAVAPARARAAIPDVLGHYVGAWTNLTFNSTGKAVIDITQVSPTAANVVFDMDGFVFGFVDPPAIAMPATISGDLIQIDNKGVGIFGDIKGLIDSAKGTFSVVLSNVPGGFISRITANGTVSGGRMKLVYVVTFPGPSGPTNPANGVMDVSRPPALVARATELGGGKVRLDWTGPAGPYQVQSKASLGDASWTNVGSPTAATSLVVDTAPGRQFFRVAIP